MKDETVSLWKSVRGAAISVVLVGTAILILTHPRPTQALDCFGDCDQQYPQCSGNCCPYSDCSLCGMGPGCTYCGVCGFNYGQCIGSCWRSVGTGECWNQTACSYMFETIYADCMAGEGGECINGDGTISGGCCYNSAVQQYFGCCYP